MIKVMITHEFMFFHLEKDLEKEIHNLYLKQVSKMICTDNFSKF